MTDSEQEIPWEVHFVTAAQNFGLRCRELHDSYPYAADATYLPVLVSMMSTVATELWDQGFSQAEINSAFRRALADLPAYAAGEERRGDSRK
jgi:hypothetical protein